MLQPDRRGRARRTATARSCRSKLAEVPKQDEEEVPPRPLEDRCAAASTLSQLIRRIEFTEAVKRRLDRRGQGARRGGPAAAARGRRHRAAAQPEDQGPQGAEAEGRGEEEPPQAAEGHRALRSSEMIDDLEETPERLTPHARDRSTAARRRPSRPRRSWSKPTCASSSRSPRSTPTAACSSST